jgi:hypothetical protein
MASWWRESDFQIPLLTFLVRDRNFLKRCGSLLSAKDFKPSRDETDERWIVATLALDFWREYHEPIEGMLRPNVADFCDENNVDKTRKKALTKLVDKISSGEKLVAVEAMEDKVVKYLRSKKMKDSIEELITKQEEGKLDNATFVRICKEVTEWSGKTKKQITSYLEPEALEHRIARRKVSIKNKRPLLFLEGFDSKSTAIGRGDLGLILAPYKKGKSLALAHISDAYAKQNLKVLYITLEDPKDEVEDRMDAATAYLPINRLNELPNKLRKRFKKFSKRINGQIRIVDCTEDSVTVADIEEIWERLRDQGWCPDAVIIDYDDELRASKAFKGESARRYEFADIYRDLRKFAARRSIFLWTACQSRKVPDNTKIMSGDKVAEDVSKIRKATLVLGIGQGESHLDARYIFVAAAKRGPSHFGFEIMSNPANGLFYDSELTYEMITLKKKQEEETESRKKRSVVK